MRVGWRHRSAMWRYFCHCWGIQADWSHAAFPRGLYSGLQISWYSVHTFSVNLHGHLFMILLVTTATDYFTVVLPQGGAHPGTAVCTWWCKQRNATDDHWDSKWEQSFPLRCYTAYLQKYYSSYHHHDYHDLYGNSKAVKINHDTLYNFGSDQMLAKTPSLTKE